MIKVGLDVPHGENTAGKRVTVNGKVYKEHHFGSKLCIRMEELMEVNGFEVVMPQQPFSNDIPLNERRDIYIDENVDIVLSTHANWNGSSAANGTCAFYWHTDAKAKRFAECLISEVKADGDETHGTGFHPSMLKSWTNLFIARALPMTSVLVENGFMSGSRDFHLIFGSKQAEYIERRAVALVKGLCKYYGKSFKLSNVVKTSSSAKVYYRVQVGSYTQIPLVAAFAESVEKKTKITTYLTEVDGQMKVQVGAFAEKGSADKRLALIKSFGYKDAFITTKSGKAVQLTEPYNDPIDKVPAKPAVSHLAVDGSWGPAVTGELQKYFKTPVTRAISKAPAKSTLIEAMQRFYRSPVTGQIAWDGESALIKAMQRYHGTPVTGRVSDKGSLLIKEVQKQLNAGKYPKRK